MKRQQNDKDPINIGPKEWYNLREAICDGGCFIIWIGIPRFHKFQPINSPIDEWSEDHLLSILINVLHLLISRHDIGLDYAAIVGFGIECTENQRAGLKYEVTVTFPTITAGAPGSIRCACVCVISLGLVQVDVTCIVHGQLPALPKEYEFQRTGTSATLSYLGSVGHLSLLSCIKTVHETSMDTDDAVFRHALQPRSAFEGVSQEPDSIGRAFQEVTVQCLAVLNIDYDPRTVLRVVSGNAGDAVKVVIPTRLSSSFHPSPKNPTATYKSLNDDLYGAWEAFSGCSKNFLTNALTCSHCCSLSFKYFFPAGTSIGLGRGEETRGKKDGAGKMGQENWGRTTWGF